jgi:hypothetical protein
MAEYKFFRSDAEEALQDEGDSACSAEASGGRGDIFHRLGAIIAFVSGGQRCHERILNSICSNRGGLVSDALEEFISALGDRNRKGTTAGTI